MVDSRRLWGFRRARFRFKLGLRHEYAFGVGWINVKPIENCTSSRLTFIENDHYFFRFQSESAFKSHNSKLHLERREKSYYCRECDDTFTCLVKHSLHIVVHRTWTQEEMGMQCRICGKVFSRNQTLPFHR